MKQQALLADKEITVGHCILAPGEKAAEEIHAATSETIVVLRGCLTVDMIVTRRTQSGHVSTRSLLIASSEDVHRATFIPAGIAHAVTNASATEPVEFLAIMRKVASVVQ